MASRRRSILVGLLLGYIVVPTAFGYTILLDIDTDNDPYHPERAHERGHRDRATDPATHGA